MNPIDFENHRSRSRGFWGIFLCAWCCGYPWTVLSLEQGLIILYLLWRLWLISFYSF